MRSATRFVVIMDKWESHDYYHDLDDLMKTYDEFKNIKMYVYDSSTNIAIVVFVNGEVLKSPYKRLNEGFILLKYLSQEN
jgi:hypothetical protein